MKAVVLIGGKGTRLRPITYTVPKAMVPLRNRPYIQYMVGSLRRDTIWWTPCGEQASMGRCSRWATCPRPY